MKATTERLILLPLFYLMAGIVTLACISCWTSWPLLYKLVVPMAFAIVAARDFFVRLRQHGADNEIPTAKPVAAPTRTITPVVRTVPVPAKPTAPVVTKPKTPAKKAPPNRLKQALVQSAIGISLIIVCILGFSWLFRMLDDHVHAAEATGSVTVINPFGIGHDYNQKVERTFKIWTDQPGKIYDVCELDAGQHWKWYFDRDFEYRLNVTGRENFETATRANDCGSEFVAKQNGILQVKSNSKHNRVSVNRLVPYETH